MVHGQFLNKLEQLRCYADGIITPGEEKKLQRVKKKEIRDLQRNVKRLSRAGANLGTVFRVRDIDELMNLFKGFPFQNMAVLASDHSVDSHEEGSFNQTPRQT